MPTDPTGVAPEIPVPEDILALETNPPLQMEALQATTPCGLTLTLRVPGLPPLNLLHSQ